jgi:hypothetical protein
MVLDGGFPALVTQLLQSRGSTEPVIIQHDIDKWANYLIVTGRNHNMKPDLQAARDEISSMRVVQKKKSPTHQPSTELEQAVVALDVATRLGHTHMRKILEQRVATLRFIS